MSSRDKVLVVGATGLLGGEIVRLLAGTDRPVRVVIRDGCDEAKRAALVAHGVEVVSADLKHPGSLDEACRDVGTVISTASATISRRTGDSIESVDQDGQLALVAAAEKAGVGHFVFVSFAASPIDFALQRAKRTVEERLRGARLSYTILQPTHFFEIWLGPALGFEPASGKARTFGGGVAPYTWISLHDVARFAVKAASGGKMAGLVLPLAGPDALSQRDVIAMFEEQGAGPVAVEDVPAAVLEDQLRTAADPIPEAYAALMLALVRGLRIDARPQLELLPGQLRTVRQYVSETMQRSRR
jgi:uncharacterized protein YbjT (DUF2867 family)